MQCNYCGGTIIIDRSETVCSGCGIVLSQTTFVNEKISIRGEYIKDHEYLDTYGLVTTLHHSALTGKEKKFRRLARINSSRHTANEVSFRFVSQLLRYLQTDYQINYSIVDDVYRIFNRLQRILCVFQDGKSPVMSRPTLVVIIAYGLCVRNGYPVTINELVEYSQSCGHRITSHMILQRFSKVFGFNIRAPTYNDSVVTHYLYELSASLNKYFTPEQTLLIRNLAVDIAEKMRLKHANRYVYASSLLYAAHQLLYRRKKIPAIPQTVFVKMVKVSENTVRVFLKRNFQAISTVF